MFYSEIIVRIHFEKEDRERLKSALNVLEEIAEAFEKAGGNTEMSENYVRGAAHVLDEILREEDF